jgi:tetratricopeptide (TPR) repeat protein
MKGKTARKPFPRAESRTVRVFLSSTFRDFAEERDLLVRKVFPELRRKCRERQVELVDVDLRWGITEEEARQGKVLPICLAEIDRSRPYFMGFIGERYGWVPERNQYDLSLLLEQSWLEEHRGGKSVTELEMLYGVLNNPAMDGRAFFYFRNPDYSRGKGPDYLSEGKREKANLEALKDRIRRSGFPVVENYRSPAELARRVQNDLWKLVDEAFPECELPDALDRERVLHEAYGATRRKLYLGGGPYFKALDAAMQEQPFRPVLVCGQSGGGKSALLANWVGKWAKQHPKSRVILHHLGCGADAADPVRMAKRLMEEIAQTTGDEFGPESDPDKLLEKLPEWLSIASAWSHRNECGFLIVLDGLDKIADHKHLRWFPSHIPPGIKLVASCLNGEILEAAQNRLEWTQLKVKPLTKTGQKQFIAGYLGRYRKSLTPKQTELLLSHSLSGNPLFLLTALEELRVFGVHEKLDSRLRCLLSPPMGKPKGAAPTVDDVFEHVLARIEDDLGKEGVQAAMEAIWASRSGLFQDELLAVAKLVPAQWAAIQNSLDESLYDGGGKINFGHDYLRKAVEDRYKLAGKRKSRIHRRLAEWFAVKKVDARVAFELPWQWQMVGAWRNLKQTLTNPAIFCLAYAENKYDLLGYWLAIQNKKSLSSEYKFFLNDKKTTPDHESMLGDFLHFAGERTDLSKKLLYMAFLRKEAALGISNPETHRSAEVYWESLYESNLFTEAESFHADLFKRTIKKTGELHPGIATIYSSTGLIRKNQGRAEESMELYEKALAIRRRLFGDLAPETLKTLSAMASAKSESGKLYEAESIYRKVLEARTKNLGANHEKTLLAASSLALVLKRSKRTAEAEKLCRDILVRREEIFGRAHPETLKSISLLASIHKDSGYFESAKKLYQEVVQIRMKSLGAKHTRTLQALHGLGSVHKILREHSVALELLKKAYKGRKNLLGEAHPDSIATCLVLADLLSDLGNKKMALKYLKSSLFSLKKTKRWNDPKIILLENKISKLLIA